MTIRKPMLAARLEDLNTIKYSVLCSPKIDGIRALIVEGKAVTRSFKPIPNNFIRNQLEATCPNGFDGELVLKNKPFNETSSAIMREDGEPDFNYIVFDYCTDPKEGYSSRMETLSKQPKIPYIEYLLPIYISDEFELLKYETQCLSNGYEGVMLRSITGPYKFGRSTVKEGYLLKLKRFHDSEAIIISINEKMSNQNIATKDAFGHTERSTHQINQIPANTMGSITVKDIKTNVEFGLGTGFDDNLRLEIWQNQSKYIGQLIKYKSQKVGEKDAPRFPVFLGFRDLKDM